MNPVSVGARFMGMKRLSIRMVRVILAVLLGAVGATILGSCDRTAAPLASKLTKANVDQIHQGMTKSQVQSLLGSPTDSESKDLVIYKRTTYHYLEGKVYVNVSFKNDELDTKETNIGTQ